MKDTITIVLIGKLFSGKTTLISRYVSNRYIGNNTLTIGASFRFCDFDFLGKNIKIHLCNVAGQERFRCIAEQFIKRVDIIIMVYSVDDRTSFEKIKTFWLPTVEEECRKDGK